jgi:hypothetical protein
MLDGHIFNSKATVFLVPTNEHPSHLALRSMTGCFAHPYKATPLSINGANRPLSLRLSALVILTNSYPKRNIPTSSSRICSTVPIFPHPSSLYFIPYTNQLLRVPLIFLSPSPLPLPRTLSLLPFSLCASVGARRPTGKRERGGDLLPPRSGAKLQPAGRAMAEELKHAQRWRRQRAQEPHPQAPRLSPPALSS